MKTVRDTGSEIRIARAGLRNPLDQDQAVWRVVPFSSLVNGSGQDYRRTRDATGILDEISATVGPPTAMCILGDNVIGAAGWEGVPLEAQYRAVTRGAGAFVASNMLYLSVRGPGAAAVLDGLTPRSVSGMAVGQAMFTLFTTPEGAVDEEAIVLRTGEEEFLLSCGGGKPVSGLAGAASAAPGVVVEEADTVSFNIKGPCAREAMRELVRPEFGAGVLTLRPFNSMEARTRDGEPVRILKTIVGIEMWGNAEAIRSVWGHMLAMPDRITPCAWDVLNVFRLECEAMIFILYPLDVHAGISLWEAGYGWMVDVDGSGDYVGREALLRARGKDRLWLAGLQAQHPDAAVPPVGTAVMNAGGEVAGFITSAGFSIRHQRPWAFAHLLTSQGPGNRLAVEGCGDWTACRLPFRAA